MDAIPLQVQMQIKQFLDKSLLGESLKAKVMRGGTWLGAGSFSEQTIRFARNMVLTRILAPEAFGTMAIVLSAGSVIHTITDIGVKEAIIQNPRGTEKHYTSVACAWPSGIAIRFGVPAGPVNLNFLSEWGSDSAVAHSSTRSDS